MLASTAIWSFWCCYRQFQSIVNCLMLQSTDEHLKLTEKTMCSFLYGMCTRKNIRWYIPCRVLGICGVALPRVMAIRWTLWWNIDMSCQTWGNIPSACCRVRSKVDDELSGITRRMCMHQLLMEERIGRAFKLWPPPAYQSIIPPYILYFLLHPSWRGV